MRKYVIVVIVFLCFIISPNKAFANTCTPGPNAQILGAQNIDYEIGTSEPDWLNGITAKDSCGNSVAVSVNNTEVKLDVEGSYFLYYTAKGTTVPVTVNVYFDMTKPEIIGYEDISVEVNTENIDFLRNVTVTDNKDTEIAGKLEIDSSKVIPTKVGTYDLIYRATDHKGNKREIIVKVHIVDTNSPTIENTKNLKLPVLKDMTNFDWWEGVVTNDNNNTPKRNLDLGNFNINKVGTYTVTYIVTDDVGNETRKSIEVKVVDEIKPEIKLNKEFIFNLNQDNTNINWLNGIEVTDNYEQIPIDRVIYDISNVNLHIPGTYKIVYFVSDLSGNYVTLNADVIVFDDDKPVINNTTPFNIFVNSTNINYLEHITATDLTDGDLTNKIVVYDKAVNLNKVGKYKLFYMVTDRSGNLTVKEVEVNVFDDQGPIIEGTIDLVVDVFDVNFDFLAGVTASDNVDGKLTVIVDKSNVNFNVLGTYVVTYSATDLNNNKTEIQVNVTVVDRVKPIISNYKDLTVNVGSKIDLLEKITASDNYDGDLTSSIVMSGNYDLNKAGEYTIKLEVEDSSGNYTSAYFVLKVVETTASESDPNTLYYIIGTICATLMLFGVIGMKSRKGHIRRR